MVIDEQCDQLFAAGLVGLVKASDKWAVEVEHARDLPGVPAKRKQRHNQLGARSSGRTRYGPGNRGRPRTRTVAARDAAVPQTPLPSGIRTQAGLP